MATSLEKSHSKWSNFKLTLLVLLASLSIPMIFLGLMLTNSIGNLGYLLVGIGGVIFLITFILLRLFKR
jgi:hypothetical protein